LAASSYSPCMSSMKCFLASADPSASLACLSSCWKPALSPRAGPPDARQAPHAARLHDLPLALAELVGGDLPDRVQALPEVF
jgi:hypothetical protein